MSKKKHLTTYFIFLVLCIISVVFLKPPFRNNIPILWGFIGLGFHAYLLWKSSRSLSSLLINKHLNELDKLGILHLSTQYSKEIEIFKLFTYKKEIEAISQEVKNKFEYMQTVFHLTWFAFLMFVVLGFLTVAMTW